MKVQTPWLYQFLLNPEQIRYTTVLRMPRFNMDPAEGVRSRITSRRSMSAAYPYQELGRREPTYLAGHAGLTPARSRRRTATT
ncbi:MAG: hypothetical protein R3B90_10480 [Planctomycetaceae bacterium]